MTTYLTIITTVLVLTQIIRVTQNAMQLRKHSEFNNHNDYILKVYQKIENYIDSKENE